MVFFKIAIRSLLKRKKRIVSIGVLVLFGTVLIVFGQEFSRSTKIASRKAIVENLTGDFIIYSSDSKEKPSPLTWSSPLTNIKNIGDIKQFLSQQDEVKAFTAYAQNIAIISVQQKLQREIPFIFTAIEPDTYTDVFNNFTIKEGSFFGREEPGSQERGIVISEAQNKRFTEIYDTTLKAGDSVTLLGVTPGGAVNAVKTTVLGVFTSNSFSNIYDYINFMDMDTYSSLYNFTGVETASLPPELIQGLSATSEDEIFSIGEDIQIPSIDLSKLKSTELSGYTLVSVLLKEGVDLENFLSKVVEKGAEYGFLVEQWEEASGGFSRTASFMQAFIVGASGLIFLVVALIIMNTLIINILERTGEIGTIRAIGGSKGFIRLVFLSETLVLNVTAGIAGIIISSVLIAVFSATGIQLPSVISNFLVGGGRLYLSFEPVLILQALLIIIVISIAATLYPLRVATKITPMKAMSELV
jgi:putative ABC transport system permease protein